MIDKYTPQVGDRVRLASAIAGIWIDVLHVGDQMIFGRYRDGGEDTWPLDRDWVKVETPAPLPERWITLDSDGVCDSSLNRAFANLTHLTDRMAVIHVYTDANGVDHADIERVTR